MDRHMLHGHGPHERSRGMRRAVAESSDGTRGAEARRAAMIREQSFECNLSNPSQSFIAG